MKVMKWSVIALAVAAGTSQMALASQQSESKGFVEDASLDLGDPERDLSQAGAAIKFQVSNTVLKYGNQMPMMPVLAYDDSRLLPESFTGTLITRETLKKTF